jgi:glycosyltransferase involved in cell wall biosynthesis
LAHIKPDLVVIQNDPWNIPEYLKNIEGVPVVATMPVDGKNCQGSVLNGLAGAIFWTQFGLDEARAGGYTGPAAIVPLGVDLNMYKPMDRLTARKLIGLPEDILDKFIFGNVNRNQPRKRLDLTVEYFADFVKRSGANDAYLFLFVAPTGDMSYEVQQLMHHYGFRGENKRLILVKPDMGQGEREELLSAVYSSFDVQITTTQGEGWGLTTMEGMACGVPQIVPDWAALGEWPGNAVIKVPCTAHAVTPNRINVIGGVPGQDEFVSAMQFLYNTRGWSDNSSGWAQCQQRGLDLVQQPQFRWPAIGAAFGAILEGIALGVEAA